VIYAGQSSQAPCIGYVEAPVPTRRTARTSPTSLRAATRRYAPLRASSDSSGY